MLIALSCCAELHTAVGRWTLDRYAALAGWLTGHSGDVLFETEWRQASAHVLVCRVTTSRDISSVTGLAIPVNVCVCVCVWPWLAVIRVHISSITQYQQPRTSSAQRISLSLSLSANSSAPMDYSGYDCRNKCDFSFRQNTVNDEADVMLSWRLLYNFGPAVVPWLIDWVRLNVPPTHL